MTELSDRSFAMRRNEILTKNLYLDTIFEKFPFLQEADEVSSSMEGTWVLDSYISIKAHLINFCAHVHNNNNNNKYQC